MSRSGLGTALVLAMHALSPLLCPELAPFCLPWPCGFSWAVVLQWGAEVGASSPGWQEGSCLMGAASSCRIAFSTPFGVTFYCMLWFVPFDTIPVWQKCLWYLVMYCCFQACKSVRKAVLGCVL